jgi:hypothetical protein
MKLIDTLGWGFVILVILSIIGWGGYALGDHDGYQRSFYDYLKHDCEFMGHGVWYADQKTCLRCPKVECPDCLDRPASCELPDAGGD